MEHHGNAIEYNIAWYVSDTPKAHYKSQKSVVRVIASWVSTYWCLGGHGGMIHNVYY